MRAVFYTVGRMFESWTVSNRSAIEALRACHVLNNDWGNIQSAELSGCRLSEYRGLTM